MPKEKNPIDYKSALERTGGDKEFLHDLLQLYMDEFTSCLTDLQEAIEKENYDKIKETAHSLKGASGNLSLPHLQEASYRMEKAGENQDIHSAKTMVSILEDEFNRLKEFLS